MLETAETREISPERTVSTENLEDGSSTQVYVAQYSTGEYLPKLVVFEKPRRLVDWCTETGTREALSGGFFLRGLNMHLGETWQSGKQIPSTPITRPWEQIRGSLHINQLGEVAIGPRYQLPLTPTGDLLQAGPVLVKNGVRQIQDGVDNEGFSDAHDQFDSDISIERHPRSAIGVSEDNLWSVVCDGRSPQSAGMTLAELANFMIGLGVRDALNLDGGGSATSIWNSTIVNNSIGEQLYSQGREIMSAIAFVAKN